MTLITNEIHLLDGLDKSIIVYAADRRITVNGRYHSTRKKLFRIGYLDAGVSYFGLAEVFPNGRQHQYMSDWLPAFITKNHGVPDLETFAKLLRDELNTIVPPQLLRKCPSGFHIAGYNKENYPDFFYFSNIGRSENFEYVDLGEKYGEPASHFLGRDAKELGWDGTNPKSAKGGRIYRNGEIKAHVVAWEDLDKMLMSLFQFPDFKSPSNVDEYGNYVKTKFEMLAYIYKKFAKKVIIARPIDVFCLYRM